MEGMTIREWIVKNTSKYSSSADAADACSAEIGIKRSTFFNTLSDLKKLGKVRTDIFLAGGAKVANLGLSEQELRSKHDALYKLEQAIKLLSPGKFVPEPEFRSTVAIDPSKFRAKADLPQFDQYKGRVGSLTYWGHPKDIQRLKDEGVLQ